MSDSASRPCINTYTDDACMHPAITATRPPNQRKATTVTMAAVASTNPFPAATPARKPLFYYGYYLVGVALVTQFVSSGTQAYTAGVFLRPMTEELDWTRGDYTLAQTVGRFLMAGVGFFVGVPIGNILSQKRPTETDQ